MTDADNKENLPNDDKKESKGNDLAPTLAQIQETLASMNSQLQATQEAVAQSRKAPVKQEDENLYDPQQLLRKAEGVFDTRLREERRKDQVIFELAKEYPEISTDTKLRQAVLEEQRRLPDSIKDTADGYEMAVLKAVNKAGIVQKSKRQTMEDDVSIGSRGGGSGGQAQKRAKKKVDPATLAVAELMGIDTSDPKRLAGLEEATNRDTYSKYR